MADLPLFPLATVLLPGQPLPLHVFEPRYRALVNDLLALPADQPRRFGVVALRSGTDTSQHDVTTLYAIGCTAEIRDVEPLPDRRFTLDTVGGVRFRLSAVDASREPYLVGSAELLSEPDGVRAAERALRVQTAYDGYADALASLGVRVREPRSLPRDPIALSYAAGAALVLDTGERQALLEAPDAATRLVVVRRLLKRETALLRETRSVPGGSFLRDLDVSAN